LEAVQTLVEEGPKRVSELIEWGARFDQSENKYLYAHEAGHRTPRILRAQGDSSGNEIVRTLLVEANKLESIDWLNRHFTVDLLTDQGSCIGALMISEEGEWVAVRARAVVLATGGSGQLFFRTTNPKVATGDGMAMAYRAGALLEDMEFVQFHPTSLAIPNAPAFLITEAMWGEGAVLRDPAGNTFMKAYHPDGDLATRDIVSRAILREMEKHRSTHVFLDATHLDSAFLPKRFPTITQTCLHYGLDITKEAIPVSPAAHFMIGGPRTAVSAQTSVRGLFAAGEVACSGVHGSNRLASNSLLEGLVFGARAAESILEGDYKFSGAPEGFQTRVAEFLEAAHSGPGFSDETANRLLSKLKRTMSEKVGILREKTALQSALGDLTDMKRVIKPGIQTSLQGEFVNLLTVGLCVAKASLLRTHSLGVHFRSDQTGETGPGSTDHIIFHQKDFPEGHFP
ncbi:MAG TPA: FAD-binding protein, partial [Nitrospiria bacterium]|nr:FAD-binding protein [Nitrospiria bacterium]